MINTVGVLRVSMSVQRLTICKRVPMRASSVVGVPSWRADRMGAFHHQTRPLMDNARIQSFVEGVWDEEIVPQLVEYIKIPNKSPLYDAKWVENGYMDQAVELMCNWAQ